MGILYLLELNCKIHKRQLGEKAQIMQKNFQWKTVLKTVIKLHKQHQI